jgi:anti-repressor protein
LKNLKSKKMELIKITEQNGKKVISARELHVFLESKKQFADWIKHRIKKYGFVENQDFQTLSLNGESGGKTIEYAITIDTAKEIAMVEGNAKGKQARQYFIECEKHAKSNTPSTLSPAEALLQSVQMIVEQERRVNLIETRQIQLEDKVLQIEAKVKTQPDDYFAIAGYASIVKRPINVTDAATIGKKATAICNRLGYVMGAVPDPRFGKVKTYPKQVLSTVFEEYFK